MLRLADRADALALAFSNDRIQPAAADMLDADAEGEPGTHATAWQNGKRAVSEISWPSTWPSNEDLDCARYSRLTIYLRILEPAVGLEPTTC